MHFKKLLHWMKPELIAFGKDFFWGTITLVFILLLIMGLSSITNILLDISSLVTKHLSLQIILSLAFLTLLGIISRKLQKSKKFSPFKKFLPAEIFKKPEVAYFSDGNKLTLGILIKVHSVSLGGTIHEMGEVVPAQGAPTSGGHLSGKLVPVDNLYLTGRTYGQCLAACMSFGTKNTPVAKLIPFSKKAERNLKEIIDLDSIVNAC